MTGFGQCTSHVLNLKGSQTMEEVFVQKGNRHAGPLPLCLGAVCGCMAKVLVAYSSAKIHTAGESQKRAEPSVGEKPQQSLKTCLGTGILQEVSSDLEEMAALAISRMDYSWKTSFNGLLTSFALPARHRAARVH